MVARQHYRWDFIGLSTDTKPTPSTSEKVVDGSTFYCSNNSKLYVWYKDQWYEKTVSGGGGGTSDFDDLTNRPMYNSVAMTSETNIPEVITYTAGSNITINDGEISATDTTYTAGANITITNGEISATDTTYSNFTGTDGTAAGTAGLVPAPATMDAGKFLKADGDWTTITEADAYIISGSGAPTTATVGTVGQLYEDTTNGKLYQCTAVTPGTDPDPDTYTWTEVGAGGSGPTVVQTAGTSTTDVMSQNATTSMIFADPATQYKIKIGAGTYENEGTDGVEIGDNAEARQNYGIGIGSYAQSTKVAAIAIGRNSKASGENQISIGQSSGSGSNQGGISIGAHAKAYGTGSIALGCYSGSSSLAAGEMNIGSSNTSYGYNNSNYRLLSGVYDGQSAHDAATVGQITPTTDSSAPTTATVGRLGQIFIDTTNADAYMCVAVDSVTPSYTWKKINA